MKRKSNGCAFLASLLMVLIVHKSRTQSGSTPKRPNSRGGGKNLAPEVRTRERLIAIYRVHNPEKIGEVDTILKR